MTSPPATAGRDRRLRRAAEFGRVIECGRSVVSPLAVLYALPRPGSCGRLGVAAGRRLGGAVCRNRMRRRWREAVRRAGTAFPSGWDVVLVARAPTRNASFEDLGRTWADLVRRARLRSGE